MHELIEKSAVHASGKPSSSKMLRNISASMQQTRRRFLTAEITPKEERLRRLIRNLLNLNRILL